MVNQEHNRSWSLTAAGQTSVKNYSPIPPVCYCTLTSNRTRAILCIQRVWRLVFSLSLSAIRAELVEID